jgi:hypothetical protein
MSPRRKHDAAVRLDPRALAETRARFKEVFPRAFRDTTYVEWERDYKEEAHQLYRRTLGRSELERLLAAGEHDEVARRALAVYFKPKLNLLALYETMALREALLDPEGAMRFGPALHELLHGRGPFGERLERFTDELDQLPQRQSRLAKWPVVTLYPFVADPRHHLLLKPNLMKRAAERFGVDLEYASRPNARTYAALDGFARALEAALAGWGPRDRIDLQGFLWVNFSDEYADWPWED